MATWRDTPSIKHRDWGLATLVGLLSVAATVGILAAAGVFASGSKPTNRASVASVLPGAPTLSPSSAEIVAGAKARVVSVQLTSPAGPVLGSGVPLDGPPIPSSAALVGAPPTNPA